MIGTADDSAPLLAGVELGGTKCVCLLGTGPDDIRARVTLPTTTPDETLDRIAACLDDWRFAALGIASFGPLDLDPASPGFGSITNTPKPGWQDVRLAGLARGRRFAIDTDVNGAALAEGHWGRARGLTSWSYITVGTGLGVGSIVAGRPLTGLGHGEAGHMRVPRPADGWPGICPFHGDCAEGLASGPAIAAHAGRPAEQLGADDPAWTLAADALAALCHNLVFATLPQRILIGGGVATGQPQLLPLIRDRLRISLADYGAAAGLAGDLADYVAGPGLGALAGPLGAIAVARTALDATADDHP